jgi:cytochrome c-type biogenesis protein CcmH/NrfF
VTTRWRYIPWILLGVVVVGILVVGYRESSKRPETSPVPGVTETRSDDPEVEAAVLAVASRFLCGCGACGELPLETCTCEVAVQERKYIRAKLGEGHELREVIAMVQETFGWMKPDPGGIPKEAASGIGAGILPIPREPSRAPSAGAPRGDVGNGLASAEDRFWIFSHFRCPCGQCNMDDLARCTCDHPRGAQEVKALVDALILAGQNTPTEIVHEIGRRYGSRRRGTALPPIGG